MRKQEIRFKGRTGRGGLGWRAEEGERKEGKMVERARELEARMRKDRGEALRGAGEKKQRLGRAALLSPSPSEDYRARAGTWPTVDMPPLT